MLSNRSTVFIYFYERLKLDHFYLEGEKLNGCGLEISRETCGGKGDISYVRIGGKANTMPGGSIIIYWRMSEGA